ncbi:MAG: peptidoglycan DD-metalloendopeptidase family protein [Patescibacteria group bacterium]|nr:peptidoglycan DD-metalloendopeptidase family protein [Patescibacteria group bacterium]
MRPLSSLSAAMAMAAAAAMIASPFAAAASAADDLQSKIDQRNQDIQSLQAEISGYQKQLDSLSGQESTLADAVRSLDLTKAKLQTEIAVTGDKIANADAEISRLESGIGGASSSIAYDRHVIIRSFQAMDEQGSAPLVAIILSGRSLSQVLGTIDSLARVGADLRSRIADLSDQKRSLESNKAATEAAKADLVTLEGQLSAQKSAIQATEAEKASLLADTKDSESQYQRLIAQKQALQEAFQQEILQYESQLKVAVDASLLPPTGSAPLSWPLDDIYVTQYFGNTPFATANSQIYNGHGHDGVDFRASIGTPVKAALGGVIVGESDTDAIPGCYSFGKWIMIKHPDGLSTLYAHLSLQTAAVGQEVGTGQVIGYSGNTGYTTGPHLHFGVYATQGVEITKFTTSQHCKNATVPLAALSAYLNPLSYLPPLPPQ